MKKLLIILSLILIGLSGCYVEPYRGHDDGYRRDRGHHEDRDHKDDHGEEHGDRDGRY